MQKIWLKHYPAGVPAEVKTDPSPSLVALTGYTRPRVITFRTEPPKSPVGKILRRALRDQAR